MIGVDSETDVKLTATDVLEADKKRRMDAASLGFSISQERVPQDRGTLQQSGFQPEERKDGGVVFGYTAPYAEPMEKGTTGFYPPLEPLQEWAVRIGKDESFGWWVARKKIPEEGVDAQPYLRPSAERMERWLDSHDLGEYL